MFEKIIIFLVVTSSYALSNNYDLWRNSGDVVNDFGWLFDIEESEKPPKHGDEENIVCETDSCKYLAKVISQGMNKTVNPCDNFYEYVCGTWDANNEIPPYQPGWGHLQMFQAAVFDRMKEILETKPQPSDILPVRQAKKWYHGCMNMNDLEKRGIKPLESILMRAGGWPMTIDAEEWDENDHSWQNIERYYFSLTGSYIFYDIDTGYARPDKDDKKQLLLPMMIKHGDIPLSEDFPRTFRNYFGNDYDAYVDLIDGVVREFVEHNKANIDPKVIEKDIKDLVEFEKKIFMLQRYSRSHFEMTTVGEFFESYRSNITDLEETDVIDLRSIVKSVFELGNMKMNDSTRIDVLSRSYFKDLTKLLSKTPKKTIVNYIHWYFISHMMKYTSEKMRELLFKMKEIKLGIKERPPRWFECLVEIRMEHATSYAFVQKYFPRETERAALEMIEHIRTEMESQINNSNWMDHESKKLATEKLNTIKLFVGFPDWYRNKTAVINGYRGLTIGTNYIDNILSFQRYSTKVKLQRIIKRDFDEGPWNISPTLVNAVYNPMSNRINVPAADFQPPLFTNQLPDNINYGMVGAVIGHEISHAFDDKGIRFGNDGKKTKLSKDMIELYYKRAECFLDQFSEYYQITQPIYEDTTPHMMFYRSNGRSAARRTRGENIADTTGLQSVFEAYRKVSEKRSHPDTKLPGFEDYTDSQMFFIAFSALWCGVKRPEFAARIAEMDPHSPSHLRVIGAISNTNDFAKAFKCPKGSPMNPENKCNIWKSLPDDENEISSWHLGSNRHHKWSQRW